MSKNNLSVLVTGGAGYIGTALVDLLLKEGFKVRVLDSLSAGGELLLPFFAHKNFEFIKGDVRSKIDVGKALKDMDVVVHLAGIVGYPACRREPVLSHDINVNGTKNLVEVTQGKLPIFLSSTGSVYGKMTEPVCTENTPINPLTEYAVQKAEGEKIVAENKEFVTYRFATAFGSHYKIRWDLLANDFTLRAVRDKTLVVYEKDFMRTFIHVRDMARSFLFATQNYDKMKGEIYNVGDDRMNFSKEELCNLIKEKVDYYLHFADAGHDFDQRDYAVSYDKIKKLGYENTVSLEDGIDELVKLSQIYLV